MAATRRPRAPRALPTFGPDATSNPNVGSVPQSAPPPDDETSGVDSLMISSLPPMMSGADIYARQFYRQTGRIPYRRYIPLSNR
jgi:hypothetical protein